MLSILIEHPTEGLMLYETGAGDVRLFSALLASYPEPQPRM